MGLWSPLWAMLLVLGHWVYDRRRERAIDMARLLRELGERRDVLRGVALVSVAWGLLGYLQAVLWSDAGRGPSGQSRLGLTDLLASSSITETLFALPGPPAIGDGGPYLWVVAGAGTLALLLWAWCRGYLATREHRRWAVGLAVCAAVGLAASAAGACWGRAVAAELVSGAELPWSTSLALSVLAALGLANGLTPVMVACVWVLGRLAGRQTGVRDLAQTVPAVTLRLCVVGVAIWPLWEATSRLVSYTQAYWLGLGEAYLGMVALVSLLLCPVPWALADGDTPLLPALRRVVALWRSQWRDLIVFAIRFWAIMVVPYWLVPALLRDWTHSIRWLPGLYSAALVSLANAVMLVLVGLAYRAAVVGGAATATSEPVATGGEVGCTGV